MKTDMYIASLIQYSLDCGLIEPCDCTYMTNQLLQVLGMDSYTPTEPVAMPLEKILKGLLDDAVERGVCGGDITSRALLDTKLMGILTPPPREVRKKFSALYENIGVAGLCVVDDVLLQNFDFRHALLGRSHVGGQGVVLRCDGGSPFFQNASVQQIVFLQIDQRLGKLFQIEVLRPPW